MANLVTSGFSYTGGVSYIIVYHSPSEIPPCDFYYSRTNLSLLLFICVIWFTLPCFVFIFVYFSDKDSALNLIIKGSSEGHFKMLQSGVVARLMNEKWERYVKVRPLLPVNYNTTRKKLSSLLKVI